MITPEIIEPMAAAMATTAAHPLSITIFPQLIRSSLGEATNIRKMGAGFECTLHKENDELLQDQNNNFGKEKN